MNRSTELDVLTSSDCMCGQLVTKADAEERTTVVSINNNNDVHTEETTQKEKA